VILGTTLAAGFGAAETLGMTLVAGPALGGVTATGGLVGRTGAAGAAFAGAGAGAAFAGAGAGAAFAGAAGAAFAGAGAGAAFAGAAFAGAGVVVVASPDGAGPSAIATGALQLLQGTVPPRLRTTRTTSSPITNVVEHALQRTCMSLALSLHRTMRPGSPTETRSASARGFCRSSGVG
jgi:hypothetical protein